MVGKVDVEELTECQDTPAREIFCNDDGENGSSSFSENPTVTTITLEGMNIKILQLH